VPTVPQILDGTPPANTAAVRVDVAPGTIWRYSGGGMTIAQLLMTDVTGEPFPELVRRLVFVPAGMTLSTYEQPLPANLAGVAASGYTMNGVEIAGKSHTYPEMMAAGLWTTASDLGRYIIEVQRAYDGKSRMLSQSTARAMLTSGLGNYGLGLSMTGAGDSLRFGHGGSNAGFKGQFMGYVSGGRGIVVLTNGDAGSRLASEITSAIGREYNWPGLRTLKERVEVAIDEKVLDGYVGKYQLTPAIVLDIKRSGAALVAQPTGQRELPVYPEGNHQFFSREIDVVLKFDVDASGKATAVTVTQNGTPTRAVRMP
jgi:CubicO group peptidase (beta-lactamase class C family)